MLSGTSESGPESICGNRKRGAGLSRIKLRIISKPHKALALLNRVMQQRAMTHKAMIQPKTMQEKERKEKFLRSRPSSWAKRLMMGSAGSTNSSASSKESWAIISMRFAAACSKAPASPAHPVIRERATARRMPPRFRDCLISCWVLLCRHLHHWL